MARGSGPLPYHSDAIVLAMSFEDFRFAIHQLPGNGSENATTGTMTSGFLA